MAPASWPSVADYPDRLSAEAIVGLLRSAGVTCYISSNEHVPGLGSAFAVRVPAPLAREARWLLEQSRVSDSELTELALRMPRDRSSDE
jgi:hypothetical protein